MNLKWTQNDRNWVARGTRYTYRLNIKPNGTYEVEEFDEIHQATISKLPAEDLVAARNISQEWENLEAGGQ